MKLKGMRMEDFTNYKKPAMFLAFPSCTFKCEKECGVQVCQNGTLAQAPNIEIGVQELIDRYLANPITSAIVCGGLEPFDDFEDLKDGGAGKFILKVLVILLIVGFVVGLVVLANHFLNLGLF